MCLRLMDLRQLHTVRVPYQHTLGLAGQISTVAGSLNDLHVYDPVLKVWSDHSYPLSGTSPSVRALMGLASSTGKIFLFGGVGPSSGKGLNPTRFFGCSFRNKVLVNPQLLSTVVAVFKLWFLLSHVGF